MGSWLRQHAVAVFLIMALGAGIFIVQAPRFTSTDYKAVGQSAKMQEPYQARTFTPAELEAGRKQLSPEAYNVVVNEDTEPPFHNAYWHNEAAGIYVDVVTGRPLFSSTNKYDSGTGWPSFYQALEGANLTFKTDSFLGIERTEVRSEAGHLGHIFDDGPKEHGGKRYCMNSLALRFVPKEEMEREGYGEYLKLF